MFRLEKSRPMVEFYRERFSGSRIGIMFEIGIRFGASVALFHRLLNPGRLVAIDIVREPPPLLEAYIRANQAEATLHPYCGVDQGDAAALRRVLADTVADSLIDLVIDDGCHWYPESRVAFNVLFPRLRPGGVYVLEDWGWAHWPGIWQDHGGLWPDRGSLTQLILELVMTSASRPEVVASVEVRSDLALVRRGEAPLDENFDISACYMTAGRRFVELGPHMTILGRTHARVSRNICSAVRTARAQGLWGVLAKLAERIR